MSSETPVGSTENKQRNIYTASLAAILGALCTLGFAPWQWVIVPLLSLAVFNKLLSGSSAKQGFVIGTAFGTGLYLGGISWVYVSISEHGNFAAPVAVLLTALLCLVLGLLHGAWFYLYSRYLQHGKTGRTGGFAAIWVLCEWTRSWFLTGFPWLYLGNAYIDTPIAAWAPIAGVLSLSFIVAFGAAALAQVKTEKLSLVTTLVVLALSWPLANIEWTTAKDSEPTRVAVVQANIQQADKWQPGFYREALARYQRQTDAVWDKAELIVWPESALPALLQNVEGFLAPFHQVGRQEGKALLLGSPQRLSEDGFNSKLYNSAVMLGAGQGQYHKHHLVPFGEYIPFYRYFGELLEVIELPIANFDPGPALQTGLRTARGELLLPYICYEIVFADAVARQAWRADFLVTLSNDAWFGDSIGPSQHMQIARMRALENGRELLRSTGTGITAIVDHRGEVRQALPRAVSENLIGELRPREGRTPFSHTQSWPLLLLCLVLIGMSQAGVKRPDTEA